jgi:hypothetical protein
MKQKIIILNFEDASVLVFDYDPNVYEDTEDFLYISTKI